MKILIYNSGGGLGDSIQLFDLIIDLQSKLRNTIILKQFPCDNFYSSTFNFKFCNVRQDYLSPKYEIKNIILNIEKLLDTKIQHKKYDVNKIDSIFFDEAKKLLPDKNYICFSITQGNKYRKKSWPLEKFINVKKKLPKRIRLQFFLSKKKI